MATSAKDKDRALAQSKSNDLPSADVEMDMDDEVGMDELGGSASGLDASGTKIIVIHPGSQNLRIGLASDALPKTVPMVIARKWKNNESEEGDEEPTPKRMKSDDGSIPEPELMFGQEVSTSGIVLRCRLMRFSLQLSTVLCPQSLRFTCVLISEGSCPIRKNLLPTTIGEHHQRR